MPAATITRPQIDAELIRYNPLDAVHAEPMARLNAFAVLTYTPNVPRLDHIPVDTLRETLLEVSNSGRPGSNQALVAYRDLDHLVGATIRREDAVDWILDVLAAA